MASQEEPVGDEVQHSRRRRDGTELKFGRLGALAHKLQGVTCYASLPRLRRIVVSLQKHLGKESVTALDELMRQLDDELKAVAREVGEYLKTLDERDPPDDDSNTAIAAG